MSRRRHMSGFTLLEVLVALAVLAVALGAVVKGAADNAGNAAYLREKTFAHWVAMNRATELQINGTWPATGTRSGESEMAGRTWVWTTRVSSTPQEDIRELEVEVSARDDEEERTLARVTGYLARP